MNENNKIQTKQAIEATSRILSAVKRIESDKRQAPDLDRVKTLGKRYGEKAEAVIKHEPGAVIFGRVTEIGQMPPDRRGYTSDVDIFVRDDERFGKKAVDALGPTFRIKKDADPNRTVVERKRDGVDVFDIHQFPQKYPVKRNIKIAPSKYPPGIQAERRSDLLTIGGITQEKLYVQTRRKAAATLGKASPYDRGQEGYGPKEHRIKDAYDLVRYTYFLSDMPGVTKHKRKRLIKDATTVRDYFKQPTISKRYDNADEFNFRILKQPRSRARKKNKSMFFWGW